MVKTTKAVAYLLILFVLPKMLLLLVNKQFDNKENHTFLTCHWCILISRHFSILFSFWEAFVVAANAH